MSLVKIGTDVRINAAHFLPEYVGKCRYTHGHDFLFHVEVEGTKDEKTGMLVDFTKLKAILNEYDHDFFNSPQRGQNAIYMPTAENLAEMFCEDILHLATNIQKVLVRVYESPVSYAEAEKEK